MKKKISVPVIIVGGILLTGTVVYCLINSLPEEKESSKKQTAAAEKKSHDLKNRKVSIEKKLPMIEDKILKDKIEGICVEYNRPFYRNLINQETTVVIPKRWRFITGLEKDKNYNRRMNAIQEIRNKFTGINLLRSDIDALLAFLHKKKDTEPLSLLEFNAIKNDVCALLMDQKQRDIPLTNHLIAMYFDKSFDGVWREYCVQFMGTWYAKIHSDDEKELLRYTLQKALKDKDNIVGTAILQLGNLVKTGDFDKREIRNIAYGLSSDPDTDDKVKMTAFQVAADLDHPQIAELARQVIKENKNVLLKMSAIAVLGKSGNTFDLGELARLSNSTDIRIRSAAQAAIKKIENRGI